MSPVDDDLPEHAPRGQDAVTALTTLIGHARGGDRAAADALFSRVYLELHRLAKAQLRFHGQPGSTLDTTALVHEAYLRLATPAGLAAVDRAHFFNLAARVMRHVIVDFARRRDAERRGGGVIAINLESVREVADDEAVLSVEIMALDRALQGLERLGPDLARLVELRFFVGLPLPEIADILGRSERSLKRDWRRARAYLQAALTGKLTTPPAAG
jgi:RNA polymerase sigma factor (TIGR02999 family)